MRTVAKSAAIASAVLLTGAAGAWAQGYGTKQGNFGNQGYTQGYGTSESQSFNQGFQGNQGFNQGLNNEGYQGANAGMWGDQGSQGSNAGWQNQGSQGANAGNWSGQSWNQGMQGSSSPYAENTGAGYANTRRQGFQQQGFSGNNGLSPMAVRDELLRYGYSDIRNLHPARGWSAEAMINGQPVHVMIGERGMVATFRGADPSGWAASRNYNGGVVEGTPGYPGPRPDGNVE